MHMAASSLISTDPRAGPQSLPSPGIEAMARALVGRQYMGQLCGCWLELLLLVPQIFQLGQIMLAAAQGLGPGGSGAPRPRGAKGAKGAKGVACRPTASSASACCSRRSWPTRCRRWPARTASWRAFVFKQAVLLYLWSILGSPYSPQPASPALGQLMDGAVGEALALLAQLPASARVNTSLCWPLAVISCCTADAAVHDVLRARLRTIMDTIGLGNMRQMLVLLEHVWRQGAAETMSPWTLREMMREHQIWISFA